MDVARPLTGGGSLSGCFWALECAVGGLAEQFARITNYVIPLESRAGVCFVGLDVVMAQDALIFIEVVIRQLLGDEFARGVLGVVAFDLWKHFAECGSELDQS